jgi:hypothetical protein
MLILNNQYDIINTSVTGTAFSHDLNNRYTNELTAEVVFFETTTTYKDISVLGVIYILMYYISDLSSKEIAILFFIKNQFSI